MADRGSKSALKTFIEQYYVYTNASNEVSADDVLQAFTDTIDTLNEGTAFYEDTTYNDLITLIGSGGLTKGAMYALDYECIHRIAGTTVINTASAQYSQVIEKIIVTATDIDKINPWVHSLTNPDDLILWDHALALAEDGVTARPGKIIYRLDQVNELSAHYDWRAVLLRTGESAGTTTWTTGQNWTRGDIVNAGTTRLYRATDAWQNDTVGPSGLGTYQWVNASPTSVGIKWVWAAAASYLGASIARTNLEDRFTFQSSKSCHLGPTTQNDGYNAITFTACTDVSLGEESYNAMLMNCVDLTISGSVVNSVLGSITNCRGSLLSQSYLWSCEDMTFFKCVEDAIYGAASFDIRESNDNNIQHPKDVVIGQAFRANSVYSITNSSIGSNAFGNIIRNVQNSSIENTFQNNYLSGIESCTIGNGVNTLAFDADSAAYSRYVDVTIKDGCYDLSCSNAGNVNRVTFGKGCYNIHVVDGARMDDTTFGHSCSNFQLEANCIIQSSTFGAACSDFDLNNVLISGLLYGGTILRSEFGANCSAFIVEGNSAIVECSIGANAQTWTVNDQANIIYSSFGANNTTLTVTGSPSSINRSSFGNDCDSISVSQGAGITYTNVGNKATTITINGGSFILDTEIHSSCTNFVMTNSSNLTNSIVKSDSNGVTITNGAQVIDSTLSSTLQNKTFSTGSIGASVYKGVSTLANDITSETYGSAGNPEDALLPNDNKFLVQSTAVNPVELQMQAYGRDSFFMEDVADVDVNTNGMARNKVYKFILSNTDGSSHDWLFGFSYPAAMQYTHTVNAGAKQLVHLMRVSHGATDKILQVYAVAL